MKRGAAQNPQNRFDRIAYTPDPEEAALAPERATELLRDRARSVITTNDSPDVGFRASLNPYRGCEHGCSYCYARPTHEYLGFSAGLDFETRILVKEEAPALLRAELAAASWEPQPLILSGVTDPYQPVESKLRVTRRCLEVLAEARNPVAVITKNRLVTRDLDLLSELARHDACAVDLSITTLDADLAGRLEPRASRPALRLEAITRLRDAGVPAGVMVAPVIPGLTDEQVPSILKAAADAGAMWAGYTVLRLPHAVKDVFCDWLDRHASERKAKILARVRALRGGRLNDPQFRSRMRGRGVFADQIGDLFRIARRRAGIPEHRPDLSTAAFRAPGRLF